VRAQDVEVRVVVRHGKGGRPVAEDARLDAGEQLQRPAQVALELGERQLRHVAVPVAVRGQHVPVVVDLLQHRGELRAVLRVHEEGRAGIAPGQDVERGAHVVLDRRPVSGRDRLAVVVGGTDEQIVHVDREDACG